MFAGANKAGDISKILPSAPTPFGVDIGH